MNKEEINDIFNLKELEKIYGVQHYKMYFEDGGELDVVEYNKYLKLEKENKQLKDNWNKLREYFKFEIEFDKRWYIPESEEYTMQKHFPDDTLDGFRYALEKMQELEKGSEE